MKLPGVNHRSLPDWEEEEREESAAEEARATSRQQQHSIPEVLQWPTK